LRHLALLPVFKNKRSAIALRNTEVYTKNVVLYISSQFNTIAYFTLWVIMEISNSGTNIEIMLIRHVFARNERVWQKKASLCFAKRDINR